MKASCIATELAYPTSGSGHKRPSSTARDKVRFTRDSGHLAAAQGSFVNLNRSADFSATQRNRSKRYSITLSARATKPAGIFETKLLCRLDVDDQLPMPFNAAKTPSSNIR
jgi:hypothetical protein